ncbi:Laccase-15 [Zea mays]|uniref:laccase n=2 Tax=Zea mays TaxID=4577 RepID=A0A8J8XNA3_MAIZE|nr:Laccase-7 [Zea mays]PWZ41257.1 Laccase-15 [Zea mays]
MTHLCEETPVTVVNGQLPGPAIEVTEGDSVAVHVINKSPYNMTIHWHGVKQRMNCWADGVPMVTQCPIRPNHSFTYRFSVAGQEGTLWWHAHVSCLRGSVHGALIIRPRHGASSYPFPKPHKEVPLVIGEWWQTDLGQIDKSLAVGFFGFNPSSATLNGKLGDLNNCSSGGVTEEGYVLEVEAGKTYLLRLINAALISEYYLKIAGHRFTVVAADANYVKPYATDVIAIAPGETVDALLVADAAPGRSYYVRGGSLESIIVATMNNASFQLPAAAAKTILEAHYDHTHNHTAAGELYTPLPERPPWPFNFTDRAFIPIGPVEAPLEPTRKATTGRRFRYGDAVEVVFQNTAVMQSDYNPMHLHGHDMFVLAQGRGNFDAARDAARFNLVDPPVRNTVLVPSLGWAVVRFVADNPG